jgi:hypothetical protein
MLSFGEISSSKDSKRTTVESRLCVFMITGISNILPDTLQKTSIQVITTAECQTLVDNVIGARIWDNHICLFDTAEQVGSCNVS